MPAAGFEHIFQQQRHDAGQNQLEIDVRGFAASPQGKCCIVWYDQSYGSGLLIESDHKVVAKLWLPVFQDRCL